MNLFKILTLSFLLMIILISCESEINLNEQKRIDIGYYELPEDIQNVMMLAHTNRAYRKTYFLNLDSANIDGRFEFDDGKALVRAAENYFIVGKKRFTFSWDGTGRSEPYVLFDKKIYFLCEIAVSREERVLEAKYQYIDLSEYLKY